MSSSFLRFEIECFLSFRQSICFAKSIRKIGFSWYCITWVHYNVNYGRRSRKSSILLNCLLEFPAFFCNRMNKGRQYCITLFICVFSGYQGIKFNGWFSFWYAPEFVFGSCDMCRTLSREVIEYFSLYFSLWTSRKTYIFVSSAHPIQSTLIFRNNSVNFAFLLVYSKSIRFFIILVTCNSAIT